jgi:uncharacterized protein (DUF983 family)
MTTDNINAPEKTLPEFKAALHAKCPKCHTGNMFANSMYGFSGQKMHTNCPYCNFQFEVEPGYFYVAMFVSYGMNIIEMLTFAIGTFMLTHSESPWLYVGILFAVTFILSPFNYRYSRVMLLYWLTPNLHFDPERAKKPWSER